MPVVGVRCPVKKGKEHIQTISSCLKCAMTGDPPCQFTQAVLLAMFSQENREGIHVSDLLSCPRQALLKKRVDYTVDPVNLWHLLRGKMIHLMLERATKSAKKSKDIEDALKDSPQTDSELTLQIKIDGNVLTGTVDEYIRSKKLIRDYKSVKKIPNWKYPYKHHQEQINIYSVLLERNKLPVENGQVVYFDMTDARKVNCEIWPSDDRIELLKTKMSYYKQAEEDIYTSVTTREWSCTYCNPEIITECMKIDLHNSLSGIKLSNEDKQKIITDFGNYRNL